ncbi:MAG: phosphatase PAP2 family protein [Thermoguttaceae bacterium]
MRIVLLTIIFASLTCAICSFFWLDYPIAKWCIDQKCPKELRKICQLCEIFGHFYGVLFTCLIVYALDKNNRKNVPLIFTVAAIAGLTSSALKLFIARYRPRAFDFNTSIQDSFTGWFPLINGGSSCQSFPSSHTALAAGLAVVLTRLYPEGRWLFAFFAVMVALQRIVDSAHFPSDTIIGAGVGFIAAETVLYFGYKNKKSDEIQKPT